MPFKYIFLNVECKSLFMQIEYPCGRFPPLQMNQTSHLNVPDLVCVIALSWDAVGLSQCKSVFKAFKSITHIDNDSAFRCWWTCFTLLLLRRSENVTTALFIFKSPFFCLSRPPVTSVLLLTHMSPKWQTSTESLNKVWVKYTCILHMHVACFTWNHLTLEHGEY